MQIKIKVTPDPKTLLKQIERDIQKAIDKKIGQLPEITVISKGIGKAG